MGATAATLEDLLAAVTRLEAKVDELARERRRRGAEATFLSKRAAARRLGVGRPYLDELLAAGVIPTVPFRGQPRIPAADLERAAAQGLPKPGEAQPSGKRGRSGRRPPQGAPGAIGAIDVDDP
jgi:excisionase family DNA binding protein